MGINFQISHNHGLDIDGVRAVYTTWTIMDSADLFSGLDHDPVSMAYLAADRLAADDWGRCLPYDVTVSFPALHFNRDAMLVEELRPKTRRMQIVCVHVVVFKTFADYTRYKEKDNCIIHQETIN